MYKYRAINHNTTEVLECDDFKTLYRGAMYMAKEAVLDKVPCLIEIQCDGKHKYNIDTMIWVIDGEKVFAVIDVLRLPTFTWANIRSIDLRRKSA